MPSFINHLFNIRSREWPRVILLFSMAFIAVTGIGWGRLTVQPLFWSEVGVDRLGISFAVEGILAIVLVAVYSAFADRLANNRLLIIIFLVSAVAVLFGWGLLISGNERMGAFWLYPLLTVIPNILNLHWWTYVTGFYDARAAKRAVPFIAANARFAGAFAGFSVSWLTTTVGSINSIVLIWAVALLVVAVMVWLSPKILDEPTQTAVGTRPSTGQQSSFSESMREGYQYVANSSYLRWLALATLLVTLLVTFFKYQSSFIIDSAFSSESFLSQQFNTATDFLGALEAYTNLLMLPVQLFLLSRLIGKIGLSKANLIYPSGGTGVGLSLLFFSLIVVSPSALLIVGSVAYLMTNVFNTTLRNPIDYLLYNAVPLRVRGRARAFVNGMLVPLASVLGGVLLLTPLVTELDWFMPGLIASLGLVYLGVAIRVSTRYTNALVSMLEQEDYSFLLEQEAADLSVTDPAALEPLKQRLEQSESDEFTLFMVTLISNAGGSAAVPIFADLARRSEPHIRASVLDILAVTDVRGTAVEALFSEYLQDENAEVRRSALTGLERVNGRNDNHYLSVAATMLDDPDIEVKTQTLPSLLKHGDLAQREQALKVVREMLESDDNVERAYALHALGKTEDVGYLPDVVEKMQDAADRVRLEGALIIEGFSTQRLSKTAVEQLEATLVPLLSDPVERVREASLRTLARVSSQKTYPKLVESLEDPSAQIQVTAVNVLTDLGKKVIPVVHPQLDSANPQVRKMATVILGRVNRREYGPLVTAQIQANLLQMAENVGYLDALEPINSYPTISVLQNEFRDENNKLADEIFFLLTAVQDAASLAVIRESLASDEERVRANALEALESLTSPQTAELIAALLSPQVQAESILKVSRDAWELEFPTTVEAMEKLTTDWTIEPWPRSIAVYALGEIGQAMINPQSRTEQAPATPEPPEPAKRRRRKRSSVDLLDSLIDEDDPKAESKPEEAARNVDEDNRRQARRRRVMQASSLLDDLAGEDEVEAPTAVSPPQPENAATLYYPPPAIAKKFTITRILAWLHTANLAPEESVREAVERANRKISDKEAALPQTEGALLSTIERIIFLKEVLFFREMTVDQLRVLATVCEEAIYNEDEFIYKEGDAGGVLYVVVRGRVGIERESRKGVVARLATVEAYAYFGEMNLFDASERTDTAVALSDTHTLNLRREPLIALARQHPDLSLELINVLSQRLRETTDQVASLTKTHSRALHKVFDQLDD